MAELARLNTRDIAYILSYDGRTSEKKYGRPIPSALNLSHIEIDAGRSSQATLLGQRSNTYESLYLSPALIGRLGGSGLPASLPAPEGRLEARYHREFPNSQAMIQRYVNEG